VISNIYRWVLGGRNNIRHGRDFSKQFSNFQNGLDGMFVKSSKRVNSRKVEG
jgi:hypothetical protein